MIGEVTVDAPGGAPATARVREVLRRAARVVIVEGRPDEVDDPDLPRTVVAGDDIDELARLLAIVDGGTGDRCRCIGWPTILVYGIDDRRIACWTLQHQDGLRGVGDGDAELRDGPALAEWLAGRGLAGRRRAAAHLAEHQARSDQRKARWIQAAPPGLGEIAALVARGRDERGDGLDDARERLGVLLRRHYPDGVERAGVLLAWAGVAAREGGGLLWYDMAVDALLRAEALDFVFAALADPAVSPVQLDGAAGLFSGLEWTEVHGKGLPEPTRSVLIAHVQRNGTDRMRTLLSWGYFGASRSDGA